MGDVIDYSKEIGDYIGISLDLSTSYQLALKDIQRIRDSAKITIPGIDVPEEGSSEDEILKSVRKVSDPLRAKLDRFNSTVPRLIREHHLLRELVSDVTTLVESN